MRSIEVDEEVYKYLSNLAKPFVDKPNDVLRRILLKDHSTCSENDQTREDSAVMPQKKKISNGEFVQSFLEKQYQEDFDRIPPYRTLFESSRVIIFFRNFSKSNPNNLWYRIEKEPLDKMRKSSKEPIICFTNPAEGLVLEVPLEKIDAQAKQVNWIRNDYEVNIEPETLYWRELKLNLKKYRIK